MKFTIACLIATTALGIQLADKTITPDMEPKTATPLTDAAPEETTDIISPIEGRGPSPKTATALHAPAPEKTSETITQREGRGPSPTWKYEDQDITYEDDQDDLKAAADQAEALAQIQDAWSDMFGEDAAAPNWDFAQVDDEDAENNSDEDDDDQKYYGPFSGLFKNPDYKLRLATQVARHGERSPSPYYDLVEGPQFDVEPKSLTKKGAESHHAIGARVREALGWSDLTALNAADVYVLSSFKERARGSAVAQLMGLDGQTLAWPLPSVDESGFTISLPSREEDYITRADKKTCPRVKEMIKAIEKAPGTVELHKKAESWLEENFFPRVRELAGLPMADTETVLDIIDYMDWARLNDMKLKFELTPEDLSYIRVADDVGFYEDFTAIPDQPYLDSWELQHLWAEMSEVIRGDRSVQDASTLTKYFPEAAEEGATHPKLLVVQGHGITSLKELFGFYDYEQPEPASTFWINMYECETCEGDDKFMVEGFYCRYSDNLDDCEVTFDPETNEVTNTFTNAVFEESMYEGLQAYADLIGSESMDIAEICKIEYVHDEVNYPYVDPVEFWKDFTDYHGFDLDQD